jgi:hypothetical protein
MTRTLCYAVIVAGIEGSVAICVVAGRPDLLVFTFLMTYLIVSLLVSPPQRHHPAAEGAGTGAAVGGTAGGSPTYSPATRLRQNAATAG